VRRGRTVPPSFGLAPRGRKEVAMIPWREDIDAALAEAAQSGRPVLLDFTAAPV
jgi:hypothetical protein